MGSALINGDCTSLPPDDKKNKFDIYRREGDGHAEIQARGLVYETIDPEELERIGLTRGLKGDAIAELRTWTSVLKVAAFYTGSYSRECSRLGKFLSVFFFQLTRLVEILFEKKFRDKLASVFNLTFTILRWIKNRGISWFLFFK